MQNKELRKTLLPMNLQLFAESGDGAGKEAGDGEHGIESMTNDQLIAKIAELEANSLEKDAQIQQWKNSSDRASSQAADYKRQLTARMTAQEQADIAKKEAEEATKKELENLRAEVARSKATKRYLTLGMPEDLAEATAAAEVSGDMESVSKNYALHIESIKKAEYQKFLAERPEPNAGHGDDKTDPAVDIAVSLRKESGASNRFNTEALKAFL